MANTLKIKRSSIQGKSPVVSDLELGELAVNTFDGKLFIKKDDGTEAVVEIGGSSGTGQTQAPVTISESAPQNPVSGDLWWSSEDATLYVYYVDADSAQWVAATQSPTISGGGSVDLSAVSSSIVPTSNEVYDLGSPTLRWKDLYLSGSTINLGGATIKTDASSGAIALLPQPTLENPSPSGVVISASGGISVVETVDGEIAEGAIEAAASDPTAAPVPIDITTTPPQEGQALVWQAASSVFVPGSVAGGGSLDVYATVAELPLSGVSAGTMAFVSGTNRLYLWNGVGWFNIALINTNPTITGGANPSYTFASNGTPIVLTLIASDPEGIPLTWSYQVTSGTLGNTATVSQSNNVFTITPSTNTADAGGFQLTFSASDGVNIAITASSFTLMFTAADSYYKQSVLLSTTSTNNGTNNTFVDSSTNNLTVTRFGNTTQGAQSPFSPAGWSGLFDGTGDYLTAPYSTTAFDWWTDNYTVEAWVYPTSFTGWSYLDGVNVKPTLIGNNVFNSTSNYWSFGLTTTGTVHFAYFNGAQQGGGTVGTATLNAWNHIAVVKNGTNITLYLNGVGTSIGNVSGTPQSSTGTALTIGAGNNAYINGYVSNLRIVKGTAIYTANFIPSITPITAVAGTRLLTLQSNSFVDNSTNNFAITRNGDTRIKPFSPFVPTVEYLPSVHGGSAYFDGTGDFLSTAGGAGLSLDADFTVSFWMNMNALGAAGVLSNSETSFFGQAVVFLTNHSSAINKISFWAYNIASGGYLVTSTTTLTTGQWFHVAVTRQSGTLRLFVNGKLEGSRSSSTGTVNLIANGAMNVGKYWGGSFNGYLSNLQVVKGTAVYTAAFTPPTEPVTAIANTSLLMNFTNANIFDETGKVVLETVGDARASTAVAKYGTGSIFFDGSGDYLTIPQDQLFNFPGDFTLEYWVRFTSASSIQTMVSNYVGSSGGWGLQRRSDTNVLAFFYGDGVLISRSFTPTLNQWYYLTIARQGTNLRMWVDGVQQGATVTNSTNMLSTSPTYVGLLNPSIGQPFNGHISDLRITNGHARYTANFTPPTAKLGYSNAE